MEETDDFGDLYADLVFPPSLIPGLGRPAAERETDSSPKRAESADKGMVDLEARLSDYSDSGDDFNIVLNEDECPSSFPPREGAAAAAGEGELEDEGDDLAVAMGGNRQSYDLDEWPAGQKCDERGTMTKNGHRGPYAGSRLVGPSSSRVSRSSISRRGDPNQLTIPCFGGSSYKLDISEASHRGFGFSLPRSRTIFDINIDAFEQKPWRHHGVDLADYFNFGMDEESWKSYCQCLDNYRKQATMPVNHLLHQSNQGEINSLVSEDVEKGERGFGVPKGRAIQVEGGFGERIPSTDLRRPRHRDSDVVIQIAMDGTGGDVSILSNTLEHVEEGHKDASEKVSKKKPYERIPSPCCEGQICKDITNSDKHLSLKVNGSTCGGTSKEAKCKVDYKKNEENPLRIDASKLKVESRSGDQDRHTSSSYDCKNRSQECKDGYPMKKESRLIHTAPLKSITRFKDSTESDLYYSDDSRNDVRTHQEGSRVNTHEHNLSFGVHKHIKRMGLKHIAHSHVGKGEELACNLVCRKDRSVVDLWDASCKMRKRKSAYGSDDRDNLPSYKETKMSPTYKSRTYAEEHGSEKSYTKNYRKSDLLPDYGRNLDDEYCSEQMECYFSERRHDDQGVRSFPRKGSDQSLLKQRSYFMENDYFLRMAEERRERIRRGTKYEDSRSDCRIRERRVNSVHGGYLPSDIEEEIFDLKSGGHFYSTDKVTRSPVRRSRYDKSYFHLNRSSRFDDVDVIDSRHLDHRLLFSHTVEEPCSADDRGGHDAGSPCDDLPMSWKSRRREMDHRGHHDGREFQSEKTRYGYGPSIKSEYHSSYENAQESDVGDYNFEEKHMYRENIISSIQMNRQNWQLRPRHCTDNGVKLRHHRDQDCLSSPERPSLLEWSSRNENSHVNQPSISGDTFSSARQLKNARKDEIVEGYFDARDRANFVSDKSRNDLAAIGCREASHVHMNGWKGKLVRRCGKAAGEKIDTGYKVDTLMDSRHPKMTCKQEEVQVNTSAGEDSRNCQTNLKAKHPKEAKLLGCGELSKAPLRLSEVLPPREVGDEEIEEGELIEETDKQEVIVDTKDQLYETKVIKNSPTDSSLCNEKTVGTYDNKHILETLAKMEKRKERFKAPIAPKQGPEKSMNSQADVSVAAMDEVKLQRPARKRRWGGN
ncbi:FIP1[III]-like protein [Iris pallida]|uniref:FIP1[III]-like protein n=1 Tax=Iris pallida TaxID=29817 RepID=A0AAX6G6B0_IRIPA|nr:FIP1[III]-like protein [Iris pallida]